MDKKNTFLGVLFLAAGLGFMFWQSAQVQEQQRQQAAYEQALAEEQSLQTTPDDAAIGAAPGGADGGERIADLLVQDVAETPVTDTPVVDAADVKTVTLANEFIEVEFSSLGGAIQEVRFLQTKRGGRDDYVFNESGKLPALSLGLDVGGQMRELNLNYAIEAQDAYSITFALDAGNGLVLRRSYSIKNGEGDFDPYLIKHSTTVANQTASPMLLNSIYLNLGTVRPIIEKAMPNYLNVAFYNGSKAKFTPINKLTGSSGFLGIGSSAPRDEIVFDDARVEWASVKNQFFTGVLSSEEVAKELYIYPVEMPQTGDAKPERPGITGSVGYELGTIEGGASKVLDFEYFVGPKEFKRLNSLGNSQDEIMQFGFFSFISKLLLRFMYAIHSFVPNWGLSIVLMTICIKLLFWPLTAKASKSQKRMAKIQEPMAKLKEKYKDNPQKMQQETLALFREHRVNPLAGCLPLFIQMPIFLGLFYMLRTASELRFEKFLWVQDLSQPDTLFELAGFPINILPLIMGLTMFLQMSMMPVSPTADPTQQKIFKFLPFVFLIFLYNFSSGLVLYWTVQNILTIIQQKITNAMPDDAVPASASGKAGKAGKGGSSRAQSVKAKKKK